MVNINIEQADIFSLGLTFFQIALLMPYNDIFTIRTYSDCENRMFEKL